jgi:hypothetical protein
MGTYRLYSELQLDVYHAPFTATDSIAPSIWQVEDDGGDIERAVVLYRSLASATWSRCELSHSIATG